MKRTIISALHLWMKWAEKGRAAGIEHFVVSVQTGLLTFLNINCFQLIFGYDPLLKYANGELYFIVYISLVFIFFKIFLPKSFLLNQNFTATELKVAKKILVAYFILTPLLLVLLMIFLHKK